MPTSIAFVDVGFLQAAVRGPAAPQAAAVADWVAETSRALEARALRTYWYDGAFAPDHEQYADQQRYLDAVRYTPGVYVRLGHVQEHGNRLRGPIEAALRNTARDVGVAPDELLAAFGDHWQWRPVREQKGVDTLVALDMVRLAQRRAFDVAILLSGDRDLVDAVRTAQDEGVFVVLATPEHGHSARAAAELRQVADRHIAIDDATRDRLVRPAGGR